MGMRPRREILCLFWLIAFVGPRLAEAQFPDLVVQNIVMTPASPTTGQTVEVEVELRNIGNSLPLQPFYLLLFEDITDAPPIECNAEDQRLLIEDLIPAGGSSRFYTFEVTYAAPGAYVLLAFVDGCQDVPELNEENNTNAREFLVAAPLPDLVVDSLTVGTANPRPNDPFSVTVVARNVGATSAGSFRLAIVANSAAEPDQQAGCDSPVFEYIIGPVPPNVPAVRTFSVTYSNPGVYRLWGIADACGDAVQESDETNNARSIDLSVSACTDSDGDGICDDVDDCDDLNQARDWYRDADADGFGDPANSVRDCVTPDGYVADATDCDDTDPSANPAAVPQCESGVDRNCNGISDAEEQAPLWQADFDGDGFTDPSTGVRECQPPLNHRQPSAMPDPDDDDFMVPEPVTATELTFVVVTAATGRSAPQILTLRRSGSQEFAYQIDAASVPHWLDLDPLAGTSSRGAARIAAWADQDAAPNEPQVAELTVTVNGASQLQVPVTIDSRWPRFTVRHAGQGGGYVTAEWDEDPNDSSNEYTKALLIDTTRAIFEGSIDIPPGRSVFLRAYTEGDCSSLEGVYDERGVLLNDPEWFYYEPGPNEPSAQFPPCSDCTAHPLWVRMDGDREVTADFSLSGLACTTCGMVLLTAGLVGLLSTRRR